MDSMKYNIKLFPAPSGLLHKTKTTRRHRFRHQAKRLDKPRGDDNPVGSELLDKISLAAEFTNISKLGFFYLFSYFYVHTSETRLICRVQKLDKPIDGTGCRSPPSVLIFSQKNQTVVNIWRGSIYGIITRSINLTY